MKVVALLMIAVLAVVSAERQNLIHLMPRLPTIPRNSPVRTFVPNPKPKVRAPIPGTKKVEGCGKSKHSSNSNSRIVNGHKAIADEFPWQVALYIDNTYFCGGSLISNEWVLTAAHCTVGSKSIKVTMGALDLTKDEDSQVIMTSTGDQIKTHEDYGGTLLRNDIAVIKLPEQVNFTDAIVPLCLPKKSDAAIEEKQQLTASGWGLTSDAVGSQISPTLNYVKNPAISNEECKETYGVTITDKILCMSTEIDNQGTCSGDSGGPLIYHHGDRGEWVSRGVTSFGSSLGCKSGLPNGFTRTLEFVDWIETNTGIAIDL